MNFRCHGNYSKCYRCVNRLAGQHSGNYILADLNSACGKMKSLHWRPNISLNWRLILQLMGGQSKIPEYFQTIVINSGHVQFSHKCQYHVFISGQGTVKGSTHTFTVIHNLLLRPRLV